MALVTKRKILDGVYLVTVPEVGLKLLCGCPADAIKHLALKGFLPLAEKEGVKFESGPNAILLSDSLTQKGKLSNLSEFPALHMFYNQGMILPGHPNYGQKPILIGKKKSVVAQMDYIFIGNYGLVTEEEFSEVGADPEFAKEYLRMKLKFAQGRFIPSDELISPIYLEGSSAEIKEGVFISREKHNVFNISYKGKSVTIDLNLKKYQNYKPSYKLPKVKLSSPYFGIVHIGEGDGWDPNRPCLSSIVVYDGDYYLLDAGPNILFTLKAVGLKPEQIKGIFFTHVHDDHFAGLYSFIAEKIKINIFASNTVLATIRKKLEALLGDSDEDLLHCLDFQELETNSWNNVKGLEVNPIPSAHPIDTTIFIFRAKDENGYKSYGHYSDIAAISWLKKLIAKGPDEPGVTEEYIESIRKSFEIKLSLKKIDVGGPAVHGDAEDFASDKSDRLVMGHTHTPFTKRQLEIGNEVEFGDLDILIDQKPA